MGIMRNALLATASLAFVSSPALAADKLSVGVGGYMQQWVGMSSVDDTGKFDDKGKLVEEISDGTAQQSDSEIFFKGSLEADNGLTFSVKVELEGNGGGDIDESQLTVGGEFGKVTLGAEDPASTLTHQGGLDVGVSLNCGDTHKWIGSLAGCSHNGFGTYGHGHGDKNQIMYFTPRMNGMQVGVSYIPDRTQEGGNNALNDNAKDAWAIGGNYMGEFGGTNLAVSLGHYQGSQTKSSATIFDGKRRVTANDGTVNTTDSTYTKLQNDSDNTALKNLKTAVSDGGAFDTLGPAALTASTRIKEHQTKTTVNADDKTFTNAAIQVGVGSFNFGVVYAENDGGAYKVSRMDKVVTTGPRWDHDGDGCAADTNCGGGDDGVTAGKLETEVNNPANDIVMEKVVEDKSKNWDTWGASVKYTDGPMAVSLSHLATEWDDGGEQEATMLSVSYTLAPGVASKSSLFTAERSFANGREVDGTAFVTGIAIGF